MTFKKYARHKVNRRVTFICLSCEVHLQVASEHTDVSSLISIVSKSGANREKGGHEGHMGQTDQEAQGTHKEHCPDRLAWLGRG